MTNSDKIQHTTVIPDTTRSLSHPASSRSVAIKTLVLLALTAVAYFFTLRAGFIWDDDAYVYQNPTLLTLQGLWDIWFKPGATPQYYPLVFTGFWFEHALWGFHPSGYHAGNILLHTFNALLLWRLMERLKVRGAWLIAALFAVHPVTVESVAWITERKNVLSLMFYLLTSHALISWCPPHENKPLGSRNWRMYTFANVLFLCALLSKTTACTLPAAWLLVLWWKRGTVAKREWALAAPAFAMALGFGLMTAHVEKSDVGAQGAGWDFTFLERIQIAGNAVCFYAGKLLIPRDLMFVYPRWAIDMRRPELYIAPAIVLGLIAALWVLRARIGRGPLTGWLFFVGSLFPALGFFNVYPFRYSFVADHFQYLAMIGFIALLVVLVDTLLSRLPGETRQLRIVLAVLVLAALTVHSHIQTFAYVSAKALWSDTLGQNPSAALAANNLAIILRNEGDYPRAQACFEQAVQTNPGMLEARMNLAEFYFERGHPELALPHVLEAQKIEPRHPESALAEGRALSLMGRNQEARPAFVRAAGMYQALVDDHPDTVLGLQGLANARYALDQGPQAVDALTRLLHLTPNSAMVWSDLAAANLKSGDTRAAIAAYAKARILSPQNPFVLDRLARILAAIDDDKFLNPDRALALAQQAVTLTNGSDPAFLDTLSLALAVNGDFTAAQTCAQQAQARALAVNLTRVAQDAAAHQALYRQNKPVRLTPAQLAP